MKKIISTLLILIMSISLCACGSSTEKKGGESVETEVVMSNDYITIDGICVDDSYRDEDASPLRMVYLFYTLNANDSNLQIDSTYTKITIDGNNSYESEYYPGLCEYATNYYYSSYIEDVYVGSSIKVVATFAIPEADLAAGKTITISDSQIPEIENIYFMTDEIKHFDSDEEIAEAMDPEGYAASLAKREEADAATQNMVKDLLNGYYWTFYVNYTAYELEFIADNKFEVRTALGANSGTYSVRNGYIFCTYSSNGYVVEIPYTIENNEINLDVTTAFDVQSN